jgi:hypothetical protein
MTQTKAAPPYNQSAVNAIKVLNIKDEPTTGKYISISKANPGTKNPVNTTMCPDKNTLTFAEMGT